MLPARRNNQNWIPDIFNDFFDTDWMVRTNATAPAINVLENEHDYKLELAAPGLTKEDFKLAFTNNKFIGEDQIVNTLSGARKFEDFSSEDRFLDTLRKKCEARIFTQQEMTWQQIQERAATETIWQWYNPSQMETLKKDCLNRDKWREIGGYLQKGPFAKEPTEVQVEQLSFDPETKEYAAVLTIPLSTADADLLAKAVGNIVKTVNAWQGVVASGTADQSADSRLYV